jgi:integrase
MAITHKQKKGSKKSKIQRMNINKFGTVFDNHGYVGINFMYQDKRIRTGYKGLRWTENNAREARIYLDRIGTLIEQETFCFEEHFPKHPKTNVLYSAKDTDTKQPDDIIFGEYAESWYKHNYDCLSRSEKERFESMIRVHLKPRFGNLKFSELTRLHVKNFVHDLQSGQGETKKPLKGGTIRNILYVFKRLVDEAVDDYNWDDWKDIFARINLPPLQTKRVEPFTMEELEKIKAELPAWYVPYFSFALLTGMRTSEICALKWEDITDDVIRVRRTIVKGIEQETTKTKKSRRDIKLRTSIIKVIEVQKQLVLQNFPTSEYVFVSSAGKQLSKDHHGKVWRRACDKAGVKYRKPYALRHTMISHAIKAGEDLQWLATQTGHTDTTMFTRTYWGYINTADRTDGDKMEKNLKQLQLDPENFGVKNGVKTENLRSRGAGTLKYKDFL